jgi:PUL domain
MQDGSLLTRLLWLRRRAAAMGATAGGVAPAAQLALLRKMLRWPAGSLFPALDIARMLALDAGFAPALAQEAGSMAAPGVRSPDQPRLADLMRPYLPADKRQAHHIHQ